jgi:dipeptidyl aminopeptidase/acylaminoacyl peptidase
MSETGRLLFLLLLIAGVEACTRPAAGNDTFPDRPVGETLDDGIQLYDLRTTGVEPGRRVRIWLYLPPGQHARASLPAVLIAPAGSNLVTGMGFTEGDRPEHLPYVRAGFAVVAFELDGPMPEIGVTDESVAAAVRSYMRSRGGVLNAATAMDYVSAKIPEIDASRLYAAGHSSAAVVALVLTAVDPRIKAGLAYAPVIDIADRLGAQNVKTLTAFYPEMPDFLKWASPSQHVDALCRKPLMLFSARDDVDIDQPVTAYADLLARRRCPATLRRAESGGHYDSMLAEGIPAGIEWLRGVDGRAR